MVFVFIVINFIFQLKIKYFNAAGGKCLMVLPTDLIHTLYPI